MGYIWVLGHERVPREGAFVPGCAHEARWGKENFGNWGTVGPGEQQDREKGTLGARKGTLGSREGTRRSVSKERSGSLCPAVILSSGEPCTRGGSARGTVPMPPCDSVACTFPGKSRGWAMRNNSYV